MITAVPSDERRSVSFRFPGRALDLVDRAAAHAHQDRTAFVLDAAVERAHAVLRDKTVFELSPQAMDAFVAALDRPAEPTAALRALMRKKPLWEAS
jgi:uncharacterized protein (DUF1778 family)